VRLNSVASVLSNCLEKI